MKRLLSMKALWFLLALLLCSGASSAYADEIRPAYLQIHQITESQFDVLWKVPALGVDQRLALAIAFDDQTRPISEPVQGINNGYHSQRWQIRRDAGLSKLEIAVDGLSRTATEVLVRIEYLDGASLTARVSPDHPRYQVPGRSTWLQTAWAYFSLGVEHILIGLDHLLFVAALLLLVDGFGKLIASITAFTLAHSITLALSTLQIVSLPVPPVEACIALSIVFVASEIIAGQNGRVGLSARKPWVVAFVFGLLHGLGFAAALQDIGLPQQALGTALLTFNLGVEAGQLLFVSLLLVLRHFSKKLINSSSLWPRVPPYLIGSLASFWVVERVVGFW